MNARGTADLKARSYPRGTRGAYNNGCRCLACRKANRDYARQRLHEKQRLGANPWVDASEACAHLKQLHLQGVGLVSVAEATDVPARTLFDIRSGRQHHLRALTARKILSMRSWAAADNTLVPLAMVRTILDALREEGYTLTEIDRRLNPHRSRPRPLPLGRIGMRRWLYERLFRLSQRLLNCINAKPTITTPTIFWALLLQHPGSRLLDLGVHGIRSHVRLLRAHAIVLGMKPGAIQTSSLGAFGYE